MSHIQKDRNCLTGIFPKDKPARDSVVVYMVALVFEFSNGGGPLHEASFGPKVKPKIFALIRNGKVIPCWDIGSEPGTNTFNIVLSS